jgi:hypothetical protein
VDQLNNMSYYNPVTDLDWIFEPVLDQGVPKTLQGVGFGFDSDDEITDVHDIAAKCRYAIDKGYGGIMVWDITHAPASTSDSIAKYVSLAYTASTGIPAIRNAARNGTVLQVRRNVLTGLNEISYAVTAGATRMDLGLYDMQGALVRRLAHGAAKPGMQTVVLGASAGRAIKPGTYVLRLAGDAKTADAKIVFLQ